MQWWTLVATCLMAVQVIQVSECGKILLAAPLSFKSHKNFYMGIANALADRGHQLTLVSPYQSHKEQKNMREVIVKDADMSLSFLTVSDGNSIAGLWTWLDAAPRICLKALGQKEVQDLLKEKFDLAIIANVFSECFLSFVYQMNVPFIWALPTGTMELYGGSAGNPQFPSLIGFVMLSNARHPLPFYDRAVSTLAETTINALATHFHLRKMETLCRERGLCPKGMPSFYEMKYNASLTLFNSVKTIEYPPKPYVPGVIHCGGIHCHPANPLPQDLEEWVQGAGDAGFIFFSLGSAVKPSSLPEQYRKIFLEVFGSLKQRVIWKWDLDTMDDLPSNVRLGKWLPQQDILGDSRLRLFITHGGLFSTLESMYHGIPVLGIPVCNDQHMNMREVQKEGCGMSLLWNELTPESLRNAINDVMTDQRMHQEAKRRSSVMKDQPMHPADVATYWVEYVMRHNGAPHLRSPFFDMPWYTLYNVDVWLSVVVVLVIITVVTFKLLWALGSCFCSATSKTKVE